MAFKKQWRKVAHTVMYATNQAGMKLVLRET